MPFSSYCRYGHRRVYEVVAYKEKQVKLKNIVSASLGFAVKDGQRVYKYREKDGQTFPISMDYS